MLDFAEKFSDHPLQKSLFIIISPPTGAGMDYEAVAEVVGPFNDTHRRLCLEVPLIDDLFCERDPYPEDFTAVMMTDNENVTVTPTRIGVVIEDRFEPECGQWNMRYILSLSFKQRDYTL